MNDSDPLAAALAAIEHRGRIAYNDYDAPPRKDWDVLIAAVGNVLKLTAGFNVEDGHYPDPGMPPVSRADRIRAAIEQELEGTSDDR